MAILPFSIYQPGFDLAQGVATLNPANRILPAQYDRQRMEKECFCPYCGWTVHRRMNHFAHDPVHEDSNVQRPWCGTNQNIATNGVLTPEQTLDFQNHHRLIRMDEWRDEEAVRGQGHERNPDPEERNPPQRANSVQTIVNYLLRYLDRAIIFPGETQARLVSSMLKSLDHAHEVDSNTPYLWYGRVQFNAGNAHTFLNVQNQFNSSAFEMTHEVSNRKNFSDLTSGRVVMGYGTKNGRIWIDVMSKVATVPEYKEFLLGY